MLGQYTRSIIRHRSRPKALPTSQNHASATQPPHISVLLNEIMSLMKPIEMKVPVLDFRSAHACTCTHARLPDTRGDPLCRIRHSNFFMFNSSWHATFALNYYQVYVGCTLGAGGHASAMAQSHPVSRWTVEYSYAKAPTPHRDHP